jgi:hypothetical protein
MSGFFGILRVWLQKISPPFLDNLSLTVHCPREP